MLSNRLHNDLSYCTDVLLGWFCCRITVLKVNRKKDLCGTVPGGANTVMGLTTQSYWDGTHWKAESFLCLSVCVVLRGGRQVLSLVCLWQTFCETTEMESCRSVLSFPVGLFEKCTISQLHRKSLSCSFCVCHLLSTDALLPFLLCTSAYQISCLTHFSSFAPHEFKLNKLSWSREQRHSFLLKALPDPKKHSGWGNVSFVLPSLILLTRSKYI